MAGAPHDTYVVPWNDPSALSYALERLSDSVAAVVMEPVMGNAGVISPLPSYLEAVRSLTHQHGALLVFDEVITGLRVAAGGAQQLYGVPADITVLSKAIGGGFPIAAFGASSEIMEPIASGRLFHGGVYSGNALVLSAANSVLAHVLANQEGLYAKLSDRSDQLTKGVGEILGRCAIPHLVQNVGPMISIVLLKEQVDRMTDYRAMRRVADLELYIQFQNALLDRGVYIHPNQFEPLYLSTAHRREDIDEVLERMDETLQHWPG